MKQTVNRFARVLVVLLLATPALLAADDVTGKWSGSFIITMDANPPQTDQAFLVLKQTGTALTGTAGPNENRQNAISKGKVTTTKVAGKDVTKLTFSTKEGGPDSPAPELSFELTLVDGHLKGTAKAAKDGRTMSGVLDLARVK